LVNIRRDQWRKASVRRRAAALLRPDVMTRASNVESALMVKRAVWGALDALHPRRRAVIIMHELEGMSLVAIASFLGVSGMTVRWHLSMGRRDLKRILTPYMGEIK
jgi:RNA polymerase sigma-70 factor (ECF subfamily)